jgi:TPR repeat protein
MLGESFSKGDGVAKDDSEAAKWFLTAAEQGHPEAQYRLSRCYYYGTGVPKNEAEAVKWMLKSANQGNVVAQGDLGVFYMDGKVVPKDYVEAYAFLNLAAATLTTAGELRDGLEKTISREEIAAGQRRTRELQKEIKAKRSTSAELR